MKTKLKISGQASRLKKIRLYLGLTRAQFGKVINISQFTLRSWENGAKNFTAEGVERLINALKKKIKFSCDFDWLMNGAGLSPISLCEESKSLAAESINIDSSQNNLLKEIVLFKKLNANANVIEVSNNNFLPLAVKGDYVALLSIDILKMKKLINQIVFVSLKDNLNKFGILKKDKNKKNDYVIISLMTGTPFLISKDQIDQLSQIIWFRKNCQ